MKQYIKYLEQAKKWISNPNLDEKVKEELLTMQADEYKDDDHLNGKGAQKYTKALCDLINRADSPIINDLFFQTYDEKNKYNRDDTLR